MKAEIIAVGTELLIGDVVNTNATWLSKALAGIGIDVFYHTVVGDNPKRIHGILAQAVERSDVLIFTGGLGPTEDDLTVAAIADYFQASLIVDPASKKIIRDYFIARGMPMSQSNVKQALKPEDAVTIPNPVGTAPGVIWDVSGKTGKTTYILTFPGVPKELYAMWSTGADWLIQQRRTTGESATVLVTCFLNFFGIGESKLGELLRDLMQAETPTVAPYVSRAEVRIRIAAKAPDEASGYALIEPVRQEILKRCGEYCFGENDETLDMALGRLLKEQHLTVGVAESCTGGLVSSRLTDTHGSSAYTALNVVTYSNVQKTMLLDVPSDMLETYGAVSPQVAEAMAIGIRKLSGCDIGLSLTGIAGPSGGSEDKPVGLVYIGFCGKNRLTLVKKVLVNQQYNRADIKYWFSQYALFYLREYVLQ